jgi:hypothetical protein
LPTTHYITKNIVCLRGAHAIARRELRTNPKQDVQKAFYVQFHQALYYYSPPVLFERRFRNALAPLLNPLPALDWAPALLLLKRLNVHAALVILKTWPNSWCTSNRYHDGRFSECIFGCSRDGSSDHLAHYLECPILWTITADAIRRPISADTLVRLCVRSPTKESSLSLLTAFTVYHDIKLGQTSLADQALRRIDSQHVLAHARSTARSAVLKYGPATPACTTQRDEDIASLASEF